MHDIVAIHRRYDITKALISGERVQSGIRRIYLSADALSPSVKEFFEQFHSEVLLVCNSFYGHPVKTVRKPEVLRNGPTTWEGTFTTFIGRPRIPLYKLHYEFIKKPLWDDHDPVDPEHLQDCYGLKITYTFENCLTSYPTDLKGE